MSDRPNLLFIMPDQLRADFLSCYGAEFISTPHIDSLCEHGVLFRNAYSPSPICVPARCLLMTGRNAIRNGVLGNHQFLRPDLAECGIHTWPQLLSNAGYCTASIGKMHFTPWELSLGFEHRIICEDKRWLLVEDDYHQHLKAQGLRKLHGNEHDGYQEDRGAFVHQHPFEHSWDHFVGSKTCEFIENYEDERPLAMMVGFPGPHCPYDPTQKYLDLFDPDDMPDPIPEVAGLDEPFRKANIAGNKGDWNGVDYTVFTDAHKKNIRAHYAALVKQIDDEVGTILKSLEEAGRLENTVIIFCSDHGDYLGDHGLIGKGTFYESSIKVPLLVRLPSAESTIDVEKLTSIADITSTLLACAGVDVPAYMDSQPLPLPGIDGASRDSIFGFLGSGMMSFDGEWKLSKYANGVTALFNIREDPEEQNNRIDDPACHEIVRRLDTELTRELLRSINESHHEKAIGYTGLSGDLAYGQPGWQRQYPLPIKPS
ncbi:MAG: sulfatase-like hydrolase/transferase [Planctomycetota bacterium]|nr:sulfatase-like hydrolase/transferase [Planctomycetota bacterium]MDP7253726.1 sulfatase-like hydrolase/transferase [Planctomycetota bacterium]